MKLYVYVLGLLACLALMARPAEAAAGTGVCPARCEGEGAGFCVQYLVLITGCRTGHNYCAETTCVFYLSGEGGDKTASASPDRSQDSFEVPRCQDESASVAPETGEDPKQPEIRVRSTREIQART